MQQQISSNSVVVAMQDQVSCDLAGEAAILNMKSGVYYGLNEVGAHIWNLIQAPRKVTDICDILLESFDVSAEVCQGETISLLQGMLAHGLIEVDNGKAA
jgi:hypothetical protein